MDQIEKWRTVTQNRPRPFTMGMKSGFVVPPQKIETERKRSGNNQTGSCCGLCTREQYHYVANPNWKDHRRHRRIRFVLPLDFLFDALECTEQCSLIIPRNYRNATCGVTMTGVFLGMTRVTMTNRNVEFAVVPRKKGKSISVILLCVWSTHHKPHSSSHSIIIAFPAADLCSSPVNAKGPLVLPIRTASSLG
jgi:hypothetical protein